MNRLFAVTEHPVTSVAELNTRADRLLPDIGRGAAQRERDRVLPFEAVAQIAKAGLFTTRIPVRYGGSGGSVKDVIALLIRIASVDSNVAQALRPGFGFVEGLLTSQADDAEDERTRWFERYLQGAVIGNAGWEVGGANGSISARIVRDGEHYRVTGNKYYSTG